MAVARSKVAWSYKLCKVRARQSKPSDKLGDKLVFSASTCLLGRRLAGPFVQVVNSISTSLSAQQVTPPIVRTFAGTFVAAERFLCTAFPYSEVYPKLNLRGHSQS